MRRLLLPIAAFALGALLILAVAELAMRALPVVTGRIRASDESNWPLRNYEPGIPYTYSFGWDMRNVQHGRTNNLGQLAPMDFLPDQAAVAVLGDSYVESAMNRYDDTIHANLARLLHRSDAAIGLAGSGLSLADYAVLADQARRSLSPRALVLVMIDGDLTESLLPRRGWHHLTGPHGNRQLVYLPLRQDGDRAISGLPFRFALYRYFRRNLGWSPPSMTTLTSRWSRMFQSDPAPVDGSGTQTPPRVLEQSVQFLLDEVARRSGLPTRCIALVVDSDRAKLYGGPPANPVDPPTARSALIQEARERGFGAEDLEDWFGAHFRRHGQRFDHSPIDRHWNALGHQVAAQAALSALRACPEAVAGASPAPADMGRP